jgi:SAM-dependent methyltransferase
VRMRIHLNTGSAVFDYIDFEPYGTIRICGWSRQTDLPHCEVETYEGILGPSATYRHIRDDVESVLGIKNSFVGFSIEFRARGTDVRRVVFGAQAIDIADRLAALVNSEVPHYVNLLDGDGVLHRGDIYAEGPPSDSVSPQTLKFAFLLQPDVLDFGCGSGALIREYRTAGIEAFGIEIERPAIKDSIRLDVAPFIKLYDGTFPLPFANGQFESVIASEVLEHIPDYTTALSEIARVCRSTLAITVPDMSCLPIGHRKGLVPWHLLEGTHVNFFNHRSLAKALEPHFRTIRFFQLARGEVEGRFMPGSLAAIAMK